MSDKMSRCKSCIFYDREKSNKGIFGTVCTAKPTPVEVLILQDSTKCKKYKEHK